MTRTSSAGPDVVVVGSLNLDRVVRAPRLPRPGETLIGSDFATDEGGRGAVLALWGDPATQLSPEARRS